MTCRSSPIWLAELESYKAESELCPVPQLAATCQNARRHRRHATHTDELEACRRRCAHGHACCCDQNGERNSNQRRRACVRAASSAKRLAWRHTKTYSTKIGINSKHLVLRKPYNLNWLPHQGLQLLYPPDSYYFSDNHHQISCCHLQSQLYVSLKPISINTCS